MAKAKRYRHSSEFRRVTLGQIAVEIDRTPTQTAKLLKKAAWLGTDRRINLRTRTVTYDAVAVDYVKALIGQPHRQLPSEPDWLRTYLGEPDGRRIRPQRRPRAPRSP